MSSRNSRPKSSTRPETLYLSAINAGKTQAILAAERSRAGTLYPRDMHHHAAVTTSAWTTFGPFVGVLVGALLGGVAQIAISRLQHLQTRFRDTAALRRTEYFDAIDVAYQMRVRLQEYAANNSGRWQPEDNDDSAEAQEMRNRDAKSAESVQALMKAADDLGRLALRVSAVGSETVLAAMDDLDASVTAYMAGFISDEMFRAARYNDFRIEYLTKLDVLAARVRADLEIDRVYKPRS